MKRLACIFVGVCVLAAVAAADTGRFGAELLAAASEGGSQNALVSPLGIRSVLAMVSQGATAAVRHAVGEMTGEAADAPARQLALVLAAAETDGRVELRGASGAFVDRRLDLFPAFAGVLQDRFGARVERLDFSADDTVTRINAWVAQATHEAIPGLLSHLEPEDALVLANAIHFRGEWTRRFAPERTAPAAFHPASGDSVEVATMQADGLPARYREDADFQAILLPYGSGAFSFAAVLPRLGLEPPEALRRLASEPSWLGGSGYHRARGSLTLPKLTLDAEASLLPTLRVLGLEAALNDPAAFAGIAAPPPQLSRVLHRTMLVVDEQGTAAAAATAAVMTTRSAIEEERGFDLRVDRPFALAVRHRETGTLLFAAWVANPTGN